MRDLDGNDILIRDASKAAATLERLGYFPPYMTAVEMSSMLRAFIKRVEDKPVPEAGAILTTVEFCGKPVAAPCAIEEQCQYGSVVDLLRRIADANVIFPSMCANNMEAWNITEELKRYRSTPQRDTEGTK